MRFLEYAFEAVQRKEVTKGLILGAARHPLAPLKSVGTILLSSTQGKAPSVCVCTCVCTCVCVCVYVYIHIGC